MQIRFLYAVFCFLGWSPGLWAQENYRVVSYNVENFFDTRKDSVALDGDYTPMGKLHWNQTRYTDKLLKLAEVLEAVGEGELPALIGLCEVENRNVLVDLIQKTGLAAGRYAVVHQDSPDRRGIDVAFLYRQDRMRLLRECFIPLSFPEDTTLHTRDILYVSGVLLRKDSLPGDTLHLFVCHFPSMLGGEENSEWKRERAAGVVKACIDSIRQIHPQAFVLMMGDLNGKADRPAQVRGLQTKRPDRKHLEDDCLYNTGFYLLNRNEGSYKYKGNWQTIDHIIVSGNLLNGRWPLKADSHLKVFAPRFLLEEDKAYYGFKPFRTYIGPRYHGGYSDHLPIYLDLQYGTGK